MKNVTKTFAAIALGAAIATPVFAAPIDSTVKECERNDVVSTKADKELEHAWSTFDMPIFDKPGS